MAEDTDELGALITMAAESHAALWRYVRDQKPFDRQLAQLVGAVHHATRDAAAAACQAAGWDPGTVMPQSGGTDKPPHQ